MIVELKSKIIFRPICWLTEIYYIIKYNSVISGHDFVGDNILICQVCGYVSKGKK